MDSKVAKKALDIADEALELSGEQRMRFLSETCGQDAQLRSEVDCLLEHSGEITIAERESAVKMPDLPPASDRFHIREELSRGGMGIVYLAHDAQLDREVAVKVLRESYRQNADLLRRFLNEAKVCGRMQHPGTPPIYEVGTLQDGNPFIAMKLVRGETLSTILKRPRDETMLAQLLRIYKRICETIAYAHSCGIIHRDLKPDNVMVSRFGDVQVMDWGLAKVLTDDASDDETEVFAADQVAFDLQDAKDSGQTTRAGTVMGTPAYMPPEQTRGARSPTIDVFQLGAILCEILTGSPPYQAESPLDVYSMASQGDLADARQRLDNCQADPELTSIARKSLEPEAEQRFANAGELSQKFTDYLDALQARLRETELASARLETRAAEERKRRWIVAGLSAAIAFSLIAGLGGLSWVMKERLDHAEEVASHTQRLAEIEREDNERRAQLEHNFNDSMLQAVQLFERAKASPLTDSTAWEEARTAIAQAESMLESNSELGDAALRLASLKDSFQSVETELKIALDVTKARDETFENANFLPWADTRPNIDKLDRVVADNGFHPDSRADEPIIIQRIKALPPAIQGQLIGAIDQYFLISDESHRETFTHILDQSDSNAWRKRWRAAVTSDNTTALVGMLTDSEVHEQSTRSLINLVRSVENHIDADTRIRFLQQYYTQHDEDAWYNYLLADLLQRNHRVEEATVFYHALLLARPNHRTRVFLAHALIRQGYYSEAIPHLQEATRARPEEQDYWNLLNYALLRSERYEETIAACQESIQAHPQNQFAQLALGSALNQLGRLDEASAVFAQIPQDEPTEYAWQARVLHAECLRQNHRYLESARVFEQIDSSDYKLLAGVISDQLTTMATVALAVADRETEDAASITDEQSSHWRRRARDWLSRCLQVRGFNLRSWHGNSTLQTMREPDTLAGLPAEEQQRWQELWDRADSITDASTSVFDSNWHAVSPLKTNTRSGAELVRQADGSFFVQGAVLPRDAYTLTFQETELSAIMLQLIPDERLPDAGTGRGELGAFELGEFALDVVRKDHPDRATPISLARCITDRSSMSSSVQRCIDGNVHTAWRNHDTSGKLRTVVFVLQRPVVLQQGDILRLHLQHGGLAGSGIGRFLIATSNQTFATQLFLPTLWLLD